MLNSTSYFQKQWDNHPGVKQLQHHALVFISTTKGLVGSTTERMGAVDMASLSLSNLFFGLHSIEMFDLIT